MGSVADDEDNDNECDDSVSVSSVTSSQVVKLTIYAGKAQGQ